MSDDWVPLDATNDEDVAEFQRLHEDLTPWMADGFWQWVETALCTRRVNYYYEFSAEAARALGETLRFPCTGKLHGSTTSRNAIDQIQTSKVSPWVVADYLLSHSNRANEKSLEAMLSRSHSNWRVGKRQLPAGKEVTGLVRRVTTAAQDAADLAANTQTRAGTDLGQAWNYLYGVTPAPSEAYRHAVRALEHALIPIVLPNDRGATLGRVIGQMRQDGDWLLPMARSPKDRDSADLLIGMLDTVWSGQHDRHGSGEPSAPGDVSANEARVAVHAAVAVVQWALDGLIARRTTQAV